MEKCSLCENSPIFKSINEFNEHIVKFHLHHKEEMTEDKKDFKPYLFQRGYLCPYCDTKLYSYKHINEHLSYEHNVHIELEELVFFVPSDFKNWKHEMEARTNSLYEEYTCPITVLCDKFKNVPKKTFYRCARILDIRNEHDTKPFVCPSSLETYMDGDVLKASFWRSHLCDYENPTDASAQFSTNVSLNGGVTHQQMQTSKKEESTSTTCSILKLKPVTISDTMKEKQKSVKDRLKKFTKRVLQTDLTDVDPCFDDTLNKMIPFLNQILDKHDFTKRLKTGGKKPFIYYPSSDEECPSDLEDENSSFEKTPSCSGQVRTVNTLKKRQLNVADAIQSTKRLKESESSSSCKLFNNNNNVLGGKVLDVKDGDNILDCNELFIHNGFDHAYYAKVC